MVRAATWPPGWRTSARTKADSCAVVRQRTVPAPVGVRDAWWGLPRSVWKLTVADGTPRTRASTSTGPPAVGSCSPTPAVRPPAWAVKDMSTAAGSAIQLWPEAIAPRTARVVRASARTTVWGMPIRASRCVSLLPVAGRQEPVSMSAARPRPNSARAASLSAFQGRSDAQRPFHTSTASKPPKGGGHLLAEHDQQVVGGQVRPRLGVGGGIVLGRREEVEPRGACLERQLLRGELPAVREGRVDVAVPAVPAAVPRPHRRMRPGRRRSGARHERCRQP